MKEKMKPPVGSLLSGIRAPFFKYKDRDVCWTNGEVQTLQCRFWLEIPIDLYVKGQSEIN